MTQLPNTSQNPVVNPEEPFVIGGPAVEVAPASEEVPEQVIVPEQAPIEAPQPEQVVAPEQGPEQLAPSQPPVEVVPAPVVEVPQPVVEAIPQPVAPEKTQEEKRIDEILSENLQDVVPLLEGNAKTAFINKGNATVKEVVQILFAPKTTERELLKLVESWFAEAKGIDAHFLKQETAIKVAALLKYRAEKTSEV